jgi:hypothetical protein
MTSFISRYVNGIKDPLSLLQQVDGIARHPNALFTWLEKLLPDKRERYKEFASLIRIHMRPLLQDEFAPDNFQPLEENKSWDDYITSIDKIIKKTSKPHTTTLLDARDDLIKEILRTGRASVQKFDKLKKQFTNFLEVSSVRGGLNTAFNNIYGLLRVIPILAEQATGNVIDKADLIAQITGKTTQRLLKKIMVLSSLAMNALVNILWQRPVESEAEAKEKFDTYLNIFDLALLSFHSPTTRLYHHRNFELKSDGLDFNKSGEYYYQAADKLHKEEKVGGCPAIQVDDLRVDGPQSNEESATAALCQLVGRIINLIPDQRFKELIEAPRTDYDTIRRQVNRDTDKAMAERVQDWQ